MRDAKLAITAVVFGALVAALPTALAAATMQAPAQSLSQEYKVSQSARTIRFAQNERRSRRNQRRNESSGGGAGLAGRYGILREKSRDVGCLLTLSNGGRAQLGPGCSDHGFVVFDPTRWQGSGNKIILRARKGHRITFSRQADGSWQRDPAAKVPLGLKKY